jgi:hypothetical protein
MKRTLTPLLLAALVAAAIPFTFAGDPQVQAPQATSQGSTQTPLVYGRSLMTPAERAAFRAQMLNARTQAERNALRIEHHRLIQARAQALGLRVPDQPRTMGPIPGGLRGTCLRGGMGYRYRMGF